MKHFDPDEVLAAVVRLFWRRGVASTGVRDVLAATGLSRSSLYATFGDKEQLHLAALRRYVDEQSRPVFARLAGDGRGVAAVAEFFDWLIGVRCAGERARWGCMATNTYLNDVAGDPAVREVLAEHHDQLRAAMLSALRSARPVPPGDLDAVAEQLALLAYGINLRSRSGADPADLRAAVAAALAPLHRSTLHEGTHADG